MMRITSISPFERFASSLMPYKIVAADNGDAWVEVRGTKLAAAGQRRDPAQDEEDR